MNELIENKQLINRRFGGIARLYGDIGLGRLQAAHVCIIGIGGVGSWVVESLARSGVGMITMIDMDLVAESNINRQILANTESIGRDKIAVMTERIRQINLDCEVHAVDDFISVDNLSQYLNSNMNFVIDCIDDFRTKAALINYCKYKKINIFTVGGAGGQIDPSKIKQSDLSRTQQDVLLAKTRKLLRQDYGFARNLKRSFGVPCVYSDEQLIYPDGEGEITAQRPSNSGGSSTTNVNSSMPNNALNCAGGLGSITHTTGSFAFMASAYVINHIVKGLK